MMERWEWVPGFEGSYQASDGGRVKSFCRDKKGKVLRPGRMNKFGHLSVALGRNNSKCVHSLVLLTFVGPRPHGMDVAHTNGIGGDNRLKNLRYCSRSENNRDVTRQGKRKLTLDQVNYIRKSRKPGHNAGLGQQLAKKFGVKYSTIHAIWIRRIYQHV